MNETSYLKVGLDYEKHELTQKVPLPFLDIIENGGV